MKIWIHRWLNFTNNATITVYCLSPFKFVYEHVSWNEDYSHTLACDRQVLTIFGLGKFEDKKNKMLDTLTQRSDCSKASSGAITAVTSG